MFGGRKTKALSLIGLSFLLAACDPTAEFVNKDFDELREVLDFGQDPSDNVVYRNGYLYDIKENEVFWLSMDDNTNGGEEFTYFMKSYTSDPVLKAQFETNAADVWEDIQSRAKRVVDQDGNATARYIYIDVSYNGKENLNSDEVSIEIDDPFSKIKCYVNGSEPIVDVIQEEDEENDLDRIVEHRLKGNCLMYTDESSQPASNKAPALDMKS